MLPSLGMFTTGNEAVDSAAAGIFSGLVNKVGAKVGLLPAGGVQPTQTAPVPVQARPTQNQTTATGQPGSVVPWYRRPLTVLVGGTVLALGLGYAFLGRKRRR